MFSSEITAEVIDQSGDDSLLCRAARVSTGRDGIEVDEEKDAGLLRYLIKNKHHSPLEHGHITFRVHVPIFVMREHMRHRVGISYNEESARYRQLEKKFYMPTFTRTQVGKPGHYLITDDTSVGQNEAKAAHFYAACATAYNAYENMLNAGQAREVARMVLPVNIYTSCYVTFNPRSLMNFVSLRASEEAQYEIRLLAGQYLLGLEKYWPVTTQIFRDQGCRV